MAITKRIISNIGDALTAQDGTVLAGIEVTFLLVNEDNHPTDAWDVLTGERIAPIKETATTSAQGEFSVSLWPNDRGSADNPTYYRCTVKAANVRQFVAALPSGDLSTLSWIEFSGNTSPLSSETYGTPLRLTAGDTVPVSSILTDADDVPIDITSYVIVFEITNSLNVTTDYPVVIGLGTAGLYSVDLSALVVGRYSVRLKITDDLSQVQHSEPFIVEVTA